MLMISPETALVTRAEWGARPPVAAILDIHPSGSAIHWEGPHMGTWDHSACASLVRGIQAFHMGPSRGWSDIAYNAIVCPHGYVYEGRWANKRSAANGTNAANAQAEAICYLSGQDDPFTAPAQRAIRDTFVYFQNSGGGSQATGHRDWYQTACPGDEIYAWVHAGMGVPGGTPPSTAPQPPPGQPHDAGSRPVLSWGSYGPAVSNLQIFLQGFGVYHSTVDGDFKNLTKAAVEEYQRARNLTVDGVVGPQTWADIDSVLRYVAGLAGHDVMNVPPFPLPAGHWFGPKSPDPMNHSGYYAEDREKFKVWQAQMKSRGWAINTDGNFTPTTSGVVHSFQVEKGLTNDGLVGQNTWATAWTAPIT